MTKRIARNRPRGFTLVEVLFVLALAGVFAGATLPLGQSYLRRGELDAAVRETASTIRSAQARAQAGSFDAGWGVKVVPGSIILFQGSTYATRATTYDESIGIPTGLVASGTTEFDFARRTGRTTSGTLTLTDAGGTSRTVAVNGFGMVQY